MPTADFLLAQRQANPLYALYQDYLRSGLPLEEYHRRLRTAAQPVPTPPTAAFATPTPQTPAGEVLGPPISLAARPSLRPPEAVPTPTPGLQLGTKEGQKAAETALKPFAITPQATPIPGGTWKETAPLESLKQEAARLTRDDITQYIQARETGAPTGLPSTGMYPPGKEPKEEIFNRIRADALETAYQAWRKQQGQPISQSPTFNLQPPAAPAPGIGEYITKIPGVEPALKGYEQLSHQVIGRLNLESEYGPLASPSQAEQSYQELTAQQTPMQRLVQQGIVDIFAGFGAGKVLSLAGKAITAVPKVGETIAAAKEATLIRPVASGITEEEWLGRFTEQLKPTTDTDVLAARTAAKAAKGTPEYAGLQDATRAISADARIEQGAVQRAAKAATLVEGSETLQEGVGRLVYGVNITKTARVGYEIEKHEARKVIAAQLGKLQEDLAAGTITDAEYQGKSAIVKSGELAPNEGIASPLEAVHVKELNAYVATTGRLLPFERDNVIRAMTETLMGETRYLRPQEIKLIGKAFGPQVAATFGKMAGMEQGKLMTTLEILNTPRAIMAAYDLSAPLRQGIMLAPGHPIEFIKAFKPMVKALVDPDYAIAWERAMLADNMAAYRDMAGLSITSIESGGPLVTREELFMGRGVTRLKTAFEGATGLKLPTAVEMITPGPWERAYTTFLNKLRTDTFRTVVEGWQNSGATVGLSDYKALGTWINWATGRGSLGPFEKSAPGLAALFFAPRFAVSRIQAPFALIKAIGSKQAFATIGKDMVAYYGGMASLLALAKFTGAADVELDPRSTEFGKFRVGNTRIDAWGGLQPIMRVVAQAYGGFPLPSKGQGRIKSAVGNVYEAERTTILLRGVQGKLSPALGFLTDLLSGHTFIGEEITASGSSIKTQAWNRLAPMWIQDLTDAIREWGPKGAVFGIGSFFGLGTLTYRTPYNDLSDAKDKATTAMGLVNPKTGKSYRNYGEMASEEGWRAATAKIKGNSDVIAAQLAVDEYQKQHGGYRSLGDVPVAFAAAQALDDADLWNGVDENGDPFGWPEWAERHTKRADRIAGAYAEYMAANPDYAARVEKERAKLGDIYTLTDEQKNKPDTLVAAYMAIFDSFHPRGDLMTDESWQALDADMVRFRSQLTPEQTASLDANLGTNDSPFEKEYARLRQEIEDAGWWKVKDNAWQYTIDHPQELADALSTKTNPVTLADVAPMIEVGKKFKTAQDYRDAIYKLAHAQTGATAVGAAASVARDPLLTGVSSIANDARAGLVKANPRVVELIAELGYKTDFRLELLAPILSSQGITLEQANAQLMAAGLPVIGTAEEREAAQKAGPAPAAVPAPAPQGANSLIEALERAVAAAKGMGQPAAPPPEPQAGVPPAGVPAPEPAPAPAAATTGGTTGGTAGGAIAGIGAGVVPTPTGATSYEGIVAEKALRGITKDAPPPTSNALDVAHALAVLGGRDLATTPAGLPPDQLKVKLAGEANWGGWIDPQTWLVVGGLGLQGKATLLPMFWTLFNASTNSTLDKTIRKDKDVQAVLLGLSHLGNATVEQYMRAFNAIVGYFTEGLTEEEGTQAEKLSKSIESLRKKEEKAAKSAAKKAAAAAEKEAAKAAELDNWGRLLAELGSY